MMIETESPRAFFMTAMREGLSNLRVYFQRLALPGTGAGTGTTGIAVGTAVATGVGGVDAGAAVGSGDGQDGGLLGFVKS